MYLFPSLKKENCSEECYFCFQTGNEDMHLKNFSLITRENKVELTPAYDLLNTTIAMGKAEEEELALPLMGKTRKIKKGHLFDYYGKEKLQLSDKTLQAEMKNIIFQKPVMEKLIRISFLSTEMKEAYSELFLERYDRVVK